MIMCKLNVCVLLIINFIYIVDGKYHFKEYEDGRRETEVGCRNVKEIVHDVRKQVKCMPRVTLMKFVLNNEYTYYPDVIPLKRCHGHCRHLSCLPIEKKMKPIALERSHINSSMISCVKVDVEEHTQCKCACEIMSSDCNSKQIYMKRDCKCKCINDEEKRECMKKSNMIWDPQNCKCMCNKMEETCSSGLTWILDKCACAKVTMMSDN